MRFFKVPVITQKNMFMQYKPCVWKRDLLLLLWNTTMLRLDPAARAETSPQIIRKHDIPAAVAVAMTVAIT
jgi:hypothetical protein